MYCCLLYTSGNVLETYDGSLKFEVTDMGTMTLHIGANMDQNMNIRIPEISCESLYICLLYTSI